MSDYRRNLEHTTVATSTTSIQVAAFNARRTYMVLQNDSDTDIYVYFGGTAVVGQGFRLNANGGSLEISGRNQNLDIREVNGINSISGGKNLLVTEA